MSRQPLLNTFVNNFNMDETIHEICRLIDDKKKSYIVPINIDVIVKIEKDDDLKRIIEEADLTLVDGQPLVWISRWVKCPVKAKVSGSDLVPKLCEVAEKKGYRLFFIGGEEGVAELARINLENSFPEIIIAGTYSPPYGFENSKEELIKMNKIITLSHPDVLIVCLGCPKQEKWIYKNYKQYDGTISICAGATIDFLAKKKRRAPKWISSIGFEWLYRLMQEPFRLFRRYIIEDMRIIRIIWKYR